MNLQGKTVLLTGACGGIGSCIAEELAKAGARLMLVGREQLALDQLCATLASNPRAHMTYVANLRNVEDRDGLSLACADAQIDILINNAGTGEFNLLEESSSETIASLLDLNLNVPIQLTRLLLPTLRARPAAAIINIGSALGSIGYPGYSVYGASKFGLRGFSEALRRELSDSTVRVMHFSPRATRTTLNEAKVLAMNAALGTAMDEPQLVAKALLKRIQNDRWHASVFGWPERFYALLNALNPAITDGAIKKQLRDIKRFATDDSNSKNANP